MALDDVGFVHLHVHSSYSLLEGALPIAKLAKLARADKMPALAASSTIAAMRLRACRERSTSLKSIESCSPTIGWIPSPASFSENSSAP